ncbi:nucleophile aminohydrolase [Chytridium lagenaria]|nr:nucleophile aminohydrolase [Chytridium lagenaria]
MSSIGTGYDLSSSTYSPDGRIFQVEYANKAVDNSGTAIGIRAKDGVILAVEKLIQSKLLVPGSNKRIATADYHVGIATAGLHADGRHLVSRIREEAEQYRNFYKQAVPGKIIAERAAQYVQAYTLYSSVRPFGTSAIIATADRSGPGLYVIEPSGVYYGYFGCAVGKGRQLAKTEIEKLKLTQMTVREAVKEAARIIYAVHDDSKDKDFELEISWVCEESGNKHEMVPRELLEEAEAAAKASLNSEMDED